LHCLAVELNNPQSGVRLVRQHIGRFALGQRRDVYRVNRTVKRVTVLCR
jgi:hypothetical protein